MDQHVDDACRSVVLSMAAPSPLPLQAAKLPSCGAHGARQRFCDDAQVLLVFLRRTHHIGLRGGGKHACYGSPASTNGKQLL